MTSAGESLNPNGANLPLSVLDCKLLKTNKRKSPVADVSVECQTPIQACERTLQEQ